VPENLLRTDLRLDAALNETTPVTPRSQRSRNTNAIARPWRAPGRAAPHIA